LTFSPWQIFKADSVSLRLSLEERALATDCGTRSSDILQLGMNDQFGLLKKW